jgi:hypothetical protein
MKRSQPTPLGVVARGAVAGAVGTLAMDVLWYARAKRQGHDRPFLEWEFSLKPDWSEVSAPGELGRRILLGFLQREPPAEWAPVVNNAMHWGYGVVWGAQYGLVAASLRKRRALAALLLGPVVWGSGYVILPLAKIYKPIWQYDAQTLAKDLGAHMVYGVTTAIAFRALGGR